MSTRLKDQTGKKSKSGKVVVISFFLLGLVACVIVFYCYRWGVKELATPNEPVITSHQK